MTEMPNPPAFETDAVQRCALHGGAQLDRYNCSLWHDSASKQRSPDTVQLFAMFNGPFHRGRQTGHSSSAFGTITVGGVRRVHWNSRVRRVDGKALVIGNFVGMSRRPSRPVSPCAS